MKYEIYSPHYSLERTLISGQVFRWNKVEDQFVGVIGKNVVQLSRKGDFIVADILYGRLEKSQLKKYLIETAKALVNENNLEEIGKLADNDAINEITKFHGVGEKVADCLLLFGYHRLNRVPIDVWVKRILVKLYDLDPKMKYEDMEEFCERHFGPYAGYATHFLFELARAGELGV